MLTYGPPREFGTCGIALLRLRPETCCLPMRLITNGISDIYKVAPFEIEDFLHTSLKSGLFWLGSELRSFL